MFALRLWLMATAGMVGTMGAVADISLQITAKQRGDGRVTAAGGGYLGNLVG
jgi:hypothetical protein